MFIYATNNVWVKRIVILSIEKLSQEQYGSAQDALEALDFEDFMPRIVKIQNTLRKLSLNVFIPKCLKGQKP
jgi:hypothetical protein